MRAKVIIYPSSYLCTQGEGFDVMKSGDARVVMIGFPSVGKVCPLSHVHHPIPYEFDVLYI